MLSAKLVQGYILFNKRYTFIKKYGEFESFTILSDFFAKKEFYLSIFAKKIRQNCKNIFIYKSWVLTENVVFYNKLRTIGEAKKLVLGTASNPEFQKLGILNKNLCPLFKGKLIPFFTKGRFYFFF